MNAKATENLVSHGTFEIPTAINALHLFAHEMAEHDMEFTRPQENQIFCTTPYGSLDLIANENSIDIEIIAPNEEALFVVRSEVSHYIGELDQNAPAIHWSGHKSVGKLIPNLRFAQVVSAEEKRKGFITVRVAGDDLSRFFGDHIHFRLLLAPAGRKPFWPYIDADGNSAWPEGEDEFHRPVYTVRSIDDDGRGFAFDVYVHGTGRACKWAKSVKAGDEIALVGPGGSGLLNTKTILMGGDETAYPAITRILEKLPSDCVGNVHLLAESEALKQDFPAPKGVKIHWYMRDAQTDPLVEALLASEVAESGAERFGWFAAEFEQVQQVRKHFKKTLGLGKTEQLCVAYWRRNPVDEK